MNKSQFNDFTVPPRLPSILRQNCSTGAYWKDGERLHHLFESMVRRQPDAVAVEATDRVLTFAALNEEAEGLANELRADGFGSGDVIALLFGRSTEAYVAMLAVMKINAAYVPLDPAFPADRVSYIAGDAEAAVILTTSEHAELAEASGLPLVLLDGSAPAGLSAPRRVRKGAASNDLAYIIYTSGSTGRPKGVRIEHQSIVNFVRVATETYGYRPGDRVYQGLTLAFDFSVEEIWVPLLAGATLVPSGARGSLLGADLFSFLVERRITALCCVPTLLATLEDDPPSLRLLIVSGEACPEEIVRRWHREGRTILNAYGPTETTVTATTSVLVPGEPVTLGTPLPTYTIAILDPDAPMTLALGEVGEIAIAGVGLSSGYVGRDDLTAKVFVPDFLDLPDNPSRRIYRTGDLGRINEKQQLEYLGRIDTQVKIRGYRIELSEIESLMLQQPGVAQAVVGTFESRPGIVELVAYYTGPIAPEALAEVLEKALPSYMVPAFYEPLEVIAMLPSDKADRKALPPPSGPRLTRSAGFFAPPATETEARLAATLAELLNLERVSVTDDFFSDLGANSLMMAHFSGRIRKEFGTSSVSMREIYGAPTVRSLASAMNAALFEGKVEAATTHALQPHIAPSYAYWATGVYQILASLAVIWGVVTLMQIGISWGAGAAGVAELYARAMILSITAFLLLTALPIAAKWLLIGRWRETSFPLWSVAYARFWTVKTLIQISPLAFVPGTPIYNIFLRALGARVAWDAMVLCPPPICTDLISIGRGAVVGREVMILGYKAAAGRIICGPVTIGADVYIGDAATLDVGTELEDGAELGHASALYAGQKVPAGQSYGGVPAGLATSRFRVLPTESVGRARRLGFTLAQLGLWLLVSGPAAVAALVLTVEGYRLVVPEVAVAASPLGQAVAMLPLLLGSAAVLFLGLILLNLARVIVLPRLAWLFLRPDRTYKLFGFHHFMLRSIIANSNSKFFNILFGDSSAIVHYLKAVGYRFPGLKQTGSNFGLMQRHDVPFLCEFGSGTMVSDDLLMANADFSNGRFRLGVIQFGNDNFLGNSIVYPANGKSGDNVLFGTRVMVPIEGPARDNIGLLGAPVFTIPRSVSRDHRFDGYKAPEVLSELLQKKNRSNLFTALLFLFARFFLLAVVVTVEHVLWMGFGLTSPLWLTLQIVLLQMLMICLAILIERASYGFGRHMPQYCSIYDPYFWSHERYWKLQIGDLLVPLNGTPFKSLVWRGLGVKVGRNLYDGGCAIVERTLVSVGDDCTLDMSSVIQPHSLEDGTFKSDHIVLGTGVTLGMRAFVHYGTDISNGVLVEPASFLMKGEAPQPRSKWGGNPARPSVSVERCLTPYVDARLGSGLYLHG